MPRTRNQSSSSLRAIALILTLCASRLVAQSTIAQVPSPLSLELRPAYDIPLGRSALSFSPGEALDLGMNYRIPRSPFSLSGGFEYSFTPLQAKASLSIAAATAGAGIALPLAGGIAARAYGMGGYYFGTYNDFSKNGNGPLVGGGLGLKFNLAPTFAINLGAQYKNYLGLYDGVSIAAGIEVALGNLGGSVDLPSADLMPAFPVFYKHYDDHPIGTVRIKSNLKVPASAIRAQVFIKEYMDSPKATDVPGALLPGESRSIDLFALFTDRLLSVTEGTKVAAEITVSYSVDGRNYENKKVETLTLWGRNAMTWDDNRKAAAFVASKDPGVLNFARSVSSYIRSKEDRSINDNLQAMIAFHEALDLYGLNYTPNPKTPYDQVSKQKDAIDFLQFPRETFQYKAGDCSDISILYASLFQAVGMDAAFVTVPGHIFVAVNTNLSPEQAPKELIPESQFISYKGKAWVPLEVTDIHGGFMKAWQLGAKEWTENDSIGQAGFYPIQEAWREYQPVGLPGADITITVPQSDRILLAYRAEVQKYLDVALAPLVAKFQQQIKANGSLAAMNGLGVLYAKYGQTDKAEQQFKQALTKRQYLPTILNLGHLYFAKGDWKSASESYQQASELDPGNARTLLALARVNQELQDYPRAKQNYDKLMTINPSLAKQFPFLGEAKESGTRAADIAGERSAILWETGE